MELIIKAASQSSSMPFSAKEAEMGMVPNMQRGDAIPIREAGIKPSTPRFLFFMAVNMEWSLSFPKTEMREPKTIPSTQ
jgi:hypothetical protein